MARRCTWLIPGDPGTRSGGYGYDRRIVDGLRARGWQVDVLSLSGRFPHPDEAALAAAEALVGALPTGRLVIADGLAAGAMPEVIERHRDRLCWIALVHHPLALETGLSAARQAALVDSERRTLAAVQSVIVTSVATARALTRYGVGSSRIAVVEPGTEPAPKAAGSAPGTGASLLCVAAVSARKGHPVLIQALAGLAERRWTLHCAGDLTRDPIAVQTLHDAIVGAGLQGRVQLIGEVDDSTLQQLYDAADLFVLPSHHEGYGMAVAEALARGLPVFATTAGALPDTVPAGAGVLVPPGDATALHAALTRWFDDPLWRAELAAGAAAARTQLPDWTHACNRFAAVLDAIDASRAPAPR